MNFEAAIQNVSLLWLLTTPHEFAHAWAAVRLGDDTPRRDGRLTLNPLAHADWLGTLILPGLTSLMTGGFLGWGKAVNTNPYRLRGGLNGLALVALAGPASNVLFTIILAILATATAGISPFMADYFAHGAYLSIYLAIFNMLPVPPLDGSKLLLAARIPTAIYNEVAQFGFLALIAAFALTDIGYWMSSWALGVARGVFTLVS